MYFLKDSIGIKKVNIAIKFQSLLISSHSCVPNNYLGKFLFFHFSVLQLPYFPIPGFSISLFEIGSKGLFGYRHSQATPSSPNWTPRMVTWARSCLRGKNQTGPKWLGGSIAVVMRCGTPRSI